MALLKRSSPWLAQPTRLSSESSNATEDSFIVLPFGPVSPHRISPAKGQTRLTRLAATLRHDRPNVWTAPAATRRRSSATNRRCLAVCYCFRRHHANEDYSDAKIFWSPHDRYPAGNGFDPGLSAETSTDKTDFLIPLFALFYFYVLFAATFDWPNISTRRFFHSETVAWT